MNQEELKREITDLVFAELGRMGIAVADRDLFEVPVSVSGRHLHLSRADMDALFGPGSELTKIKDISQPGQYASEQRVTLVGPKGRIEGLRVLGPLRKESQVELAASDARRIGLKLPVRASGNLAGTPGAVLEGPRGSVQLAQGCIIAERHIHMTPAQATQRGVRDGQRVRVEIGGEKAGVLDAVYVHVRADFAYDMHIDADDGNAFLVETGCHGRILTESGEAMRGGDSR